MAKKIIVFTTAFHPFIGGAEIALKEIMQRLPEMEFTLLTARFKKEVPETEQQDNVKIIRLGSGSLLDKYLFAFRAAKFAVKLHKAEKFDAAWAMMANYAGLAALLFKLRSGTKYLLTLQSGDSDAFILSRTWFWLPFYKMIYRRASYIQAISVSLEKRARKFGYKGELSVIPNGVDIEKFKPRFSIDEVGLLKNELNLPQDDLVIITTSRLVLKNAVDDLIRSLNTLNFKMGIPSQLLILGEGKERNRLIRLAQTKGLSDRVHFFGHVQHEELEKYFAVADVFVRPSLSEGLGNSFLESMSFGVPVVATPVGGIVDFLFDGETGLFCKPGKPYTIAQAVERYDKDRALYAKISAQGRELVRQKYNWDNIARAVGELIDLVVQKNAAAK